MSRFSFLPASAVAALALSAVALGGCANIGDSPASVAFVDPARYELYDCDRLRTERASLKTQVASQQALIDKAQTGAGGLIVGEAVYRGDLIRMQAQAREAEAAWRSHSCDAVTVPAAPAAPVTAAPAPAPATPRRR